MLVIDMDNYSTVQAALNAHTYDAAGTTLLFPNGWNGVESSIWDFVACGQTYGNTDAPIVFKRENDTATATIEVGGHLMDETSGQGKILFDGISFTYPGAENTASYFIQNTTSEVHNVGFKDCSFISPDATQQGGLVGNSANCHIYRCYFKNLLAVTVDGIATQILNSVFDNAGLAIAGGYITNCLWLSDHPDARPTLGRNRRRCNKLSYCTFINKGGGYTGLKNRRALVNNCIFKGYDYAIENTGEFFTTYEYGARTARQYKSNCFYGNSNIYLDDTSVDRGIGTMCEEDPIILDRDPFPMPGVYVPDMDPISEYVGWNPTQIAKSTYAGAFAFAGGAIPVPTLQVRY